ncbi:MAG: hypothetical protein WCC90_23345 [Methylocella sp.]
MKPTGCAGGPNGESRHSLLPGANSRRAASFVMDTLAGNPARSMHGIFWQIVLDFGKK